MTPIGTMDQYLDEWIPVNHSKVTENTLKTTDDT